MHTIYKVKEYTAECKLKRECWYFATLDLAKEWLSRRPNHREIEEIVIYESIDDMREEKRQRILNKLTSEERRILGV